MMSRALGIPDSGLLLQRESTQSIDPNEPLDKLLINRKFRQSFMEFADRSLTVADNSSFSLWFSSIPHLTMLNCVRIVMQLFGGRKCPFLRGGATARQNSSW